ncbi:hypothetical protein ACH95_14400 [Bacillus glycinifermentans]|uniref:Uncharacterized protein n=1 Tax=Bacillus glycinifermentans TaxID=1664069 RepID=A0A0J6EY20_9BACI|nr:hypothetical protein [Bacillus glycinifermentans]ATH91194.1 hypothetical protein COP00_00130 [Bacillus glycinifermentans]KMM58102.1 hypothetical protein ACH95_14400 [Bacillus glycinifermentans]KRT93521.1 hypothetical protein AB447_219265 [Bacillus glycinifermentans]MEC0485514.1 hypothetical protein [Bacillus glycinifermentans]MEC0495301.1 hypothetical protein [Bacillus glycinifermentans]
MSKISEKLLKCWLAIPRQVRAFGLALFTICFFGFMMILGIKKLFQFNTLNATDIIFCLIASAFILWILNSSNKGENK